MSNHNAIPLALSRTALAVLLVCWPLTPLPAQIQEKQPPSVEVPNQDNDTWVRQKQQEMAREQNLKRQQELKKDAAKLLDLATQLKQYVDKSNEDVLSLDVIKKADEIDKLAKSIKDKMKGP